MEEWILAVQMLGIPSVMCIWFMWKTDQVIKNNTEILYKVHESINKCETQQNARRGD